MDDRWRYSHRWIYITDLDDLVVLARGRATRSLTVEECEKVPARGAVSEMMQVRSS
jgi:hypothetical protein